MIILGVKDNGEISRINRKNLENWIFNAGFARYIHPLLFL